MYDERLWEAVQDLEAQLADLYGKHDQIGVEIAAIESKMAALKNRLPTYQTEVFINVPRGTTPC